MNELDRKLNELSHNIGMERQHKKLIRQLLVDMTQNWYHMGYEDGFEDNRATVIDECDAVLNLEDCMFEDLLQALEKIKEKQSEKPMQKIQTS